MLWVIGFSGHGNRLGVNQFADWTREEFESVLLPNRQQNKERQFFGGPYSRVHVPTVPAHMLPSTVDWRGTLADSPPKDQGMCGSCWVRSVPMILHIINNDNIKNC